MAAAAMRGFHHWRWHLDEEFVKINGETHYLWRAVDHEGEVLESYVTKTRDKQAADGRSCEGEHGVGEPAINGAVSALRFLFEVTLALLVIERGDAEDAMPVTIAGKARSGETITRAGSKLYVTTSRRSRPADHDPSTPEHQA